MIKRVIPLLFLLALTSVTYAQIKKAKKFAKSITTEDLYDRLAVLASDSLEGRETGKPGQKKAADFIRGEFKKFGLEPIVEENGEKSYYQKFDLYQMVNNEIYLTINGKRLNFIDDIVFYGGGRTEGEVTAEAVFIGNGNDIPEDFSLDNKVAVFIESNGNWRSKSSELLNKGALATIIVMGETQEVYTTTLSRMGRFMRSSRLTALKPKTGVRRFNFIVGPQTLEDLFEDTVDELETKAYQAKSKITFNIDRGIKPVQTENVLGFMPGTDLRDEVLVITSHYDHIGRKGDVINNGADDDGSGTTSVLEIAEAFSKARKKKKGPRRSILFMTVTGEEKGLLGSDYYTKNPILPLENTVTNLNIDMVGRVDSAHMDNQDYVYVIGSDKLSSELHNLSENINSETIKLDLDYKYNDENDPNRFYYRSDHYNFAKNDIPIIFYFNGVHPDYHRPTDTIEKINFPVMQKRAQLVFYTAWEIANRDSRVKLD
ncbi:MAG: M28 family peptidase [Cyclobacteriaceae bacterium]